MDRRSANPSAKVWVEAELIGGSGPNVILSLVDIRARRKLVQAFGDHNANIPLEELEEMGFPTRFLRDLISGRPVRFKMFMQAFEGLVGGGGYLNGLDGLEGERTIPEPGDRIEIRAKGRGGETVRVVGIVDSAVNNSMDPNKYDWGIQYTIQPSGQPGYWKQRYDGGTFRVLQKG